MGRPRHQIERPRPTRHDRGRLQGAHPQGPPPLHGDQRQVRVRRHAARRGGLRHGPRGLPGESTRLRHPRTGGNVHPRHRRYRHGRAEWRTLEEQGGTLPRHEVDGIHRLGRPRHGIQGPGDELLHFLRLQYRRPLHRHRLRADPPGQGRHGLLRGRRERRLGLHEHVRLHGRALHVLQRQSQEGLQGLRQEPRRILHRRRRGSRHPGGARARQGPRREDLRRARRVRRQLGRVRHGRAQRRGGGEVHGARHGRGEQAQRGEAGGIHQYARYVDAGGRPRRAGGHQEAVRKEGIQPLRRIDEESVGARARSRGRARDHLHYSHDEQ
mmetsp:Transcript_7892/g.11869  ORF Transcript_7892/g.11869 Transcript_7892/m.11869 type:complete len:326 (-) Transcript_7892:333-1310(-)